jgi:hypothetical protein
MQSLAVTLILILKPALKSETEPNKTIPVRVQDEEYSPPFGLRNLFGPNWYEIMYICFVYVCFSQNLFPLP